MAEKKLQLEFIVEGGGTTSLTLSDASQTLDSTTVETQMDAMVTAGCFESGDGAAYSAPLRATYIETTETPIYDAEDEQA